MCETCVGEGIKHKTDDSDASFDGQVGGFEKCGVSEILGQGLEQLPLRDHKFG
jgi:hypothetical protein